MALTSTGIGSNLDIEGIVSKLMSVERLPIAALDKKEISYQAKVSGFGTLKGAISQFQSAVQGLADPSKFQTVKASVADAAVATISATAAATPGSYSLQVTQLAQSQRLVANGVATMAAPVGSGVISFDFGKITGGTYNSVTGKYDGSSFDSAGAGIKTVTIEPGNDSLTGIAEAINSAGIGVTAKIINAGGSSPYRLSLTSDKTGEAAAMKISVEDTVPDTGLSALLNHDPADIDTQALSQTAVAMDAKFMLDGIAITKGSNTVTDVVEGVTLNLLKESTTATSIKIDRDTAAITASVNAFVKAYNDITQTFRDAMAYNPTTKTAAVLNGEALVRNMQTQVRNVLNTPVAGAPGALTTLYEAGIGLDKNGLLKVDTTKLDKAISKNFSDLAGLFSATGRTSDNLASYAGSSSATVPGAYDVNISNVATTATNTGTGDAVLDITSANNKFNINLNGVSAEVTLDIKDYGTIDALVAELQSKINSVDVFAKAGSSVQVTHENNALKLTSNKYGSSSTVSVTELGTPALKLAASGATVLSGTDVAGTINGIAATGIGQILTASGGSPAEGLQMIINGGSTGPRGTVTFSKGYAAQLNELANSLLAAEGPLSARTDGLADTIKGIGKQRDALNLRMQVLEARYRAQFTALDMNIAKMNSTSTYLTQQLAQISALSSGQ